MNSGDYIQAIAAGIVCSVILFAIYTALCKITEARDSKAQGSSNE